MHPAAKNCAIFFSSSQFLFAAIIKNLRVIIGFDPRKRIIGQQGESGKLKKFEHAQQPMF
jgi:hypothetical protein